MCVRVTTSSLKCAEGYVHVYVDSGQGLVRRNIHTCSDVQYEANNGWAGVHYLRKDNVYLWCFQSIIAVKVVNADSQQSAKSANVFDTVTSSSSSTTLVNGGDWIGTVEFSHDGGFSFAPGMVVKDTFVDRVVARPCANSNPSTAGAGAAPSAGGGVHGEEGDTAGAHAHAFSAGRVMIAATVELRGARERVDVPGGSAGSAGSAAGPGWAGEGDLYPKGCRRSRAMAMVMARGSSCDAVCWDNCTFILGPPGQMDMDTSTVTDTGAPEPCPDGVAAPPGSTLPATSPVPIGIDTDDSFYGGFNVDDDDGAAGGAHGTSGDGGDGLSGAAVGGIVAAIVLLVVAGVIALVAVRKRASQRGRGGRSGRPTIGHYSEEMHRLLLERVQGEFLLGYRQLIGGDINSFDDYKEQIEALTAKPSAIKLGAELGSGNYGTVYRAELKKTRPTKETVAVAVKVPQAAKPGESEASKVERGAALLLEAFVLHGLAHPRIVALVAVATHVRPIMILMEHMQGGDLRTYLRRCRPSLKNPAADIDHVTMAVMAGQMSSAMSFLERRRVIHRDIAARNVLVGSGPGDIKLSDLGAARNVKSKEDYTYIASTDHMPWRWMPLEALRDAAFSHKSDVFGFGVLVWEMCTLGRPPWGAFGLADVVKGLQDGERLQRPPDCPDQLHELTMRCWQDIPSDRPPFEQINDELQILPAILRQRGKTSDRPKPKAKAMARGAYDSETALGAALGAPGYEVEVDLAGGYVDEESVMSGAGDTVSSSTGQGADRGADQGADQGAGQGADQDADQDADHGAGGDGDHSADHGADQDADGDGDEGAPHPITRTQTVWNKGGRAKTGGDGGGGGGGGVGVAVAESSFPIAIVTNPTVVLLDAPTGQHINADADAGVEA